MVQVLTEAGDSDALNETQSQSDGSAAFLSKFRWVRLTWPERTHNLSTHTGYPSQPARRTFTWDAQTLSSRSCSLIPILFNLMGETTIETEAKNKAPFITSSKVRVPLARNILVSFKRQAGEHHWEQPPAQAWVFCQQYEKGLRLGHKHHEGEALSGRETPRGPRSTPCWAQTHTPGSPQAPRHAPPAVRCFSHK